MVPHGAGGMSAGRQQLKEVFQQHAVGGRTAAAVARKKDKLSQTKLRERELRESHKLEIQAEKEAKAAEREAARAMLRAERMMHDTKRAHKDRRRMEKREKAREAAEQRPVCEHGIKNCRLCFH